MCYAIFTRWKGAKKEQGWSFFHAEDSYDEESLSTKLKGLRKQGFEARVFQVIIGAESSLREIEL